MSKKVTREQTRQDLEHDIVAESFKSYIVKIRENQNTIFTIIIVVLAIIVAIQWIKSANVENQDKANTTIQEAGMRILTTFVNPDEEKNAIITKENDEKLQTIAAEFSGSPTGQRAQFMAGVYKYYQMNYADARTRFERFAKNAADNLELAQAKVAIGRCWESQAFLEDDDKLLTAAIENYDEAIKLGDKSYIKYQAMLNKAKILGEVEATRKQAITILAEIINERQALIDASFKELKDEVDEDYIPMNFVEIAKKRQQKLENKSAE